MLVRSTKSYGDWFSRYETKVVTAGKITKSSSKID
jgi:hypothetical protein